MTRHAFDIGFGPPAMDARELAAECLMCAMRRLAAAGFPVWLGEARAVLRPAHPETIAPAARARMAAADAVLQEIRDHADFPSGLRS